MSHLTYWKRSILPAAAFVALLAAGCKKKADAMFYCRALEAREIVRDCKIDKDSRKYDTAEFRMRSGGVGTVAIVPPEDCADSRSYLARRVENEHVYTAIQCGTDKAGPVAILPSTVDVVERDSFTEFFAMDVDQVTAGDDSVRKKMPKDQPSRSPACQKCADLGHCAVTTSAPTNCIAGFDEDCRKSKACREAGLCRANASTGMCAK